MTHLKLLTLLTALALLTACGGGGTAETKTDDKGATDPCIANPYGATCGTEFETQRQTIISDCTDDNTGDLCTEATTFACTDNFFHDLCTAEVYVQQRVEFNKTCTNTKSQEVCDAEALVRNCAANPFMNTCLMDTGAIALRESRCLANIQIDDSCRGTTGIATVFCEANPFDTATACVADTYFPDRVADCITAGNAGIARCNNLFTESASNTCLTNPFTDACTSDGAFATYADTARVNRVGFCATDSTGSSLCTALTTCQTNPFDATCGAYFADAKISHCETNDVVVCPNVTTADLLASFTANGGTALPTIPDATTRKNEFLQATATGFASGATDGIMIPLGTPIPAEIVIVKFADADTATGGVAYFGGGVYANGARVGTDRFYYAGILAGTDLGAPIAENITTAVKWRGQIRTVASEHFVELRAGEVTNFGIDITFNGTTGTMDAFFEVFDRRYYLIDGGFDDKGIITGTVDFGRGNGVINTDNDFYTPGTLTGIIGQNGAVGVFHSDNNNPATGSAGYAYSGGFVVTPPSPCQVADTCVDTADWLGSFTGNDALTTTPDATQAPVYKNQFLEITATTASSLTAVVPTTLFMTGSTTNGAAFFTENSRFYAGVLAGTNLGAPITEIITTAVKWTGQIRADSSDSAGLLTANPTDGFGLDITFGGTGTGGTMKTIAIVPIRNAVYEIDGMFDANGIITGTVDFGSSVSAGNRVVDTSHASYSPGTLSGIIGQNGAVGVFHSDNANPEAGSVASIFSGGFFVTPPAN